MYLGKFHHDRTLFSLTGIMVSKGNHPQIALFQVSELIIIIYPDLGNLGNGTRYTLGIPTNPGFNYREKPWVMALDPFLFDI